MKGPGLFLAQFRANTRPFDTLENICRWAADTGFTCVQIPSWDAGLIDLSLAAESKDYCDELTGRIISCGLTDGITELATHLQGQLVAVHPAYDEQFDAFAPPALRGRPAARTEWAIAQMKLAIKASRNLGLRTIPSFTGGLLVPYYYPWPQRPEGLVQAGFEELGRRWLPIFDEAHENEVSIAFELHHGEDVHDGDSFELFLHECAQHPAIGINYDPSHFVLMHLDYIEFIERYKDRITAYHVKDAEYRRTGTGSTIAGFQDWKNRSGRFRSLGDGQVDFKKIEQALTAAGIDDLPHVLEWECCVKGKLQGAREGARFIRALIEGDALPLPSPAEASAGGSFDDFARSAVDETQIRRMLGLEPKAEQQALRFALNS